MHHNEKVKSLLKKYVLVKLDATREDLGVPKFEYAPAIAFYTSKGKWISTHVDDLLAEPKLIQLLQSKLALSQK